MTVNITEYANLGNTSVPTGQALRATPLSSAATSTLALSSGTRLVKVLTTLPAWLLFTPAGSTVVATSTNAEYFAPNVPEFRGVSPGSRISALST